MIYFVTSGSSQDNASSRVRVHCVRRILETYGYATDVMVLGEHPWWRLNRHRLYNLVRFIKNAFRARAEDTVYMHRPVLFEFVAAVLLVRYFSRAFFITDYDDALFEEKPLRTFLLTKLADHVIVASRYSYRYAVQHNKNVTHIPVTVDVETYPLKVTDSRPLTIGWLGSPGYYRSIALLVPVLQRLIQDGYSFRFLLAGGASESEEIRALFADLPDGYIEYIPPIDWSDVTGEAEIIRRFDINVAPLLDTPFNRGKCTFKILQAMASGIPVVASPVGESNYFITHGENGFLADTTDEWVDALERLLSDKALRDSLGSNGRTRVEEWYAYDVQIPRLIEVLESREE